MRTHHSDSRVAGGPSCEPHMSERTGGRRASRPELRRALIVDEWVLWMVASCSGDNMLECVHSSQCSRRPIIDFAGGGL